MKQRTFIFKCFTLFFLAAYSLSLAGIDVHRCSHTGRTYVTFLADSISCEDIHPCGCCHHVSDEACQQERCSDEACLQEHCSDETCQQEHCSDETCGWQDEHSNKDGGCCHDEPLLHLSCTDGNTFVAKHIHAPISDVPVIVADVFCLTLRSEALMVAQEHYLPPHVPDPLDLFCVLRI